MRRIVAAVGLAFAAASPMLVHADAEKVRATLRASLPPPAQNVEAVAGDDAVREVLVRGHAIWVRRFANGRSLAGCFPNGGRLLATAHPRFDARLGRVITLETAINQCLKAHREPLLDPADADTMGAVAAYVRYLAAGHRLNVRLDSAGAENAFEAGRQFFFSRQGRGEDSCAGCHVEQARRGLGSVEPEAATRLATIWPVVRDGRALTLQVRARECLDTRMGAKPPAVESEPLANLDYFLSFLASGSPLVPNPTLNPDRPKHQGAQAR